MILTIRKAEKYPTLAYICLQCDMQTNEARFKYLSLLIVENKKGHIKSYYLAYKDEFHTGKRSFKHKVYVNKDDKLCRMHISTARLHLKFLNRTFRRGGFRGEHRETDIALKAIMLLTTVRERLRAAIKKARKEGRTYINQL